MSSFPEALPHGALRAVFPDVFQVMGMSRPHFQGAQWQFSRNMTVLRSGTELAVVNSVRLGPEGLRELDALGEVRHVLRLGAFHGRDDAFYADRYKATLWAAPGIEDEHGARVDRRLTVGGALPFAGSSLFAFETASVPELILRLDREGGILVTCDSLQNWAQADEFFDQASREKMAAMGFVREANVGPGWRAGSGVQAADFERLLGVPFRHVLPAHGSPLLEVARERFAATFREQFGVATAP